MGIKWILSWIALSRLCDIGDEHHEGRCDNLVAYCHVGKWSQLRIKRINVSPPVIF
jgi:hypothetical protein